MTATYYEDDGVTVCISDRGMGLYAAEQRDLNRDQKHAEIVMWSIVCSVVSIAALVITHLLGKS